MSPILFLKKKMGGGGKGVVERDQPEFRDQLLYNPTSNFTQTLTLNANLLLNYTFFHLYMYRGGVKP